MKIAKSAVAVTLLFAGVTAFILQSQKAQSNPPPPPAFEDHYQEKNFTIDAGDPNSGESGTRTLQFPVVDRTVRMSLTFRATDGQVAFGEASCYYRSSTGEFAVAAQGTVTSGVRFPLLAQPDNGLGILLSVGPDGATNGTVTFENSIPAGGMVHVALWY